MKKVFDNKGALTVKLDENIADFIKGTGDRVLRRGAQGCKIPPGSIQAFLQKRQPGAS
jgi:hypothetical protein